MLTVVAKHGDAPSAKLEEEKGLGIEIIHDRGRGGAKLETLSLRVVPSLLFIVDSEAIKAVRDG
jgi:hypothetical protein